MTEDRAAMFEALVKALAGLTTVEKGRTADAGSYKYAYASLDDLVTLTRPVLAKHGLVALTPVGPYRDDGLLAVTVTLYHTTGEALHFDPLPFPPGANAQATGSAISYFRRYALLAALGIATGDDDDGAKAATVPERNPAARARQRLGKVVHELDEEQRTLLRAWLEEQGLPDRPSLMTEAQCEHVTAWLVSEEGPA